MTLIEFSIFFSVIAGAISGAAAGVRHGALGLVLGGVGGVVIGFTSFAVATSPMAMLSRGEARGLRAKFGEGVVGLALFVLVPAAPVGAGIAAWCMVRLF